MSEIPNFEEFLNEDKEPINEGVNSLDHYYSNSDKSIRESAKKIDAILNKEIKSSSVKKEILYLITELVEDYAVEYHDNARPW
jgi:hypothetical protein